MGNCCNLDWLKSDVRPLVLTYYTVHCTSLTTCILYYTVYLVLNCTPCTTRTITHPVLYSTAYNLERLFRIT